MPLWPGSGSLKRKVLLLVIGSGLGFGLISSILGTTFIHSMTLQEAQTRVKNNLNSAWAVLEAEEIRILQVVNLISQKDSLVESIECNDIPTLYTRLRRSKWEAGLDFLTVTSPEGNVILRTSSGEVTGDRVTQDTIVQLARSGKSARGIRLMSLEQLTLEDDDLNRRAFITPKATPHAKPREVPAMTRGMVMMAASPILDRDRRVLGTVYGGILLNRNYELVDTIRSIVFGDETHDGRIVGTVTIFQGDTRIATNVTDEEGFRAIGTRVSEEVYDRTLVRGIAWEGRAFVVRDWYVSAYEPILDVDGAIIGMLYVGALEQKYTDMRRNLVTVFLALSMLWTLLVVLLALQLSKRILTPIYNLAFAATSVSRGSRDVRIPDAGEGDEITALTSSFRTMVTAISEREEELVNTNRKLSSANRNYLDMLSFASHELKNQIAGASIAVRTLQRNAHSTLNPSDRDLLQRLAGAMDTLGEMLRNTMDLSRLESGDFIPEAKTVDFLQDIVVPTIGQLSVLADQRDIVLENRNELSLVLHTDPGLLAIIYYNLFHNAIKYVPRGGTITLSSGREPDQVWFTVHNTGPGIPEKALPRIFERFYRETGKVNDTPHGAGLGLYITRRLVELLGGTIQVDNIPDVGIAFQVTLPDRPLTSNGSHPSS